jgi:sulfite reductase alpha subunit-like flavoprotein
MIHWKLKKMKSSRNTNKILSSSNKSFFELLNSFPKMGLCNRLLILYASQTGYAQETAERIEREAKQRHFDVELKSMDTFDISRLPLERLVCFVCSVTGQGEEPDTMKVIDVN